MDLCVSTLPFVRLTKKSGWLFEIVGIVGDGKRQAGGGKGKADNKDKKAGSKGGPGSPVKAGASKEVCVFMWLKLRCLKIALPLFSCNSLLVGLPIWKYQERSYKKCLNNDYEELSTFVAFHRRMQSSCCFETYQEWKLTLRYLTNANSRCEIALFQLYIWKQFPHYPCSFCFYQHDILSSCTRWQCTITPVWQFLVVKVWRQDNTGSWQKTTNDNS